MKKKFDYIQDAGHGWVKVPLALITNAEENEAC